MEHHRVAVETIAARVKQFAAVRKQFRIYHGSTNSTRSINRSPENTVDTSMLNRVLTVDTVKKTALVEPNVPMDALVAATSAKGLVPLIVMEFPGITAGGGFSGTSGESSSFRYGPFDATVNWIEIVIGNGDIMRASRTTDENTDLFWGAASSFGTLGVVTLLEVQLQDAKPYVRLEYSLQTTPNTANSEMEVETAKDNVDYVDAIMFSKNETVVCSGSFSDAPRVPDSTIVRFTRSFDPWFYVHVLGVLNKLKKKPTDKDNKIVEFVPLADYLFRYDRGAFWVAKYSFNYFMLPFNRVVRFLLDPLLHTRTIYHALHKSGLADFYLVQDVGVPHDKVDEFTNWLEETYGIYPLWLCPLLLARSSPNAQHGLHADFALLKKGTPESKLMNFGVWGPVPSVSASKLSAVSQRAEFIHQNRLLEQKVHELGGRKWLYAQAFYTEDEFWAHYDRKAYDSVRAKYGAEWLPSVYDKVRNKEKDIDTPPGLLPFLLAILWSIWPLRGVYGVLMVLLGGDYLMTPAKPEPVAIKPEPLAIKPKQI